MGAGFNLPKLFSWSFGAGGKSAFSFDLSMGLLPPFDREESIDFFFTEFDY
jgi:hypothetical protein